MNFRVLSCFISAFLLQVSFPANSQPQTKNISLDDIYGNYLFYPLTIEKIRTMNDGQYYTTLENSNTVAKWKYRTGEKVSDIFHSENHGIGKINDYEFSANETKLLISTSRQKIYRHSYLAEYYVFDITKNILSRLSNKDLQQLATFSPDGSKVAFVRDNDLFITDLDTWSETQVTNDGQAGKIINGSTDWVYEEEYALTKGFAWSPDSRKLAYYRFDESGVKEFDMLYYYDLYPDLYRFKYPKAGEKNSIVSILTYDLFSGTTVKMDVGSQTDQYIGRIVWTSNPEKLGIIRINRRQNVLDVLHANASTGASEIVYTEENSRYINEPTDNTLTYLPDGHNFIIQSERDGWLHFYLYNFIKKEIKPITSGEYDISGFKGFDKNTNTLYYLSHEKGAIYQDVYSICTDGTKKKRISDTQGWSDAEFCSTFDYYILNYSSADEPPTYILHDSHGNHVRILERNEQIRNRLSDYNFVKKEFISVGISDTLDLNAWIMKPLDFDPSKKYPLFVFVYGGPQSQEVKDEFLHSDMWLQTIVQKGYVVICADGRGTDGRGEAFRKSTYMQLGKYETEDQITVAKYFAAQPYIDASRIGIYGWSYGGYMSLLCLFKGADIFKMAISVAPVTNWRYYDSVYTERFMRTPNENPDGYDMNSPINHVQKMKGKLLLVHGMTDDNVHFQNSVELVQHLVEADKQFDMQFYPNRNHGISGGNSTLHLYKKMTSFIEENL